MKFSNFDLRMFNEARKEAEKSDYKRMHVGCVITYKGHIIGRGHNSNKSRPMQKMYNRKYRVFNNSNGAYIHDSVHAEIDAISSVPFVIGKDINWSKANIYVYRICNGKPRGYGNSRPCPACTNAIRDVGIKQIYYTDDDGLSYLELD